jgi:hypothetical protein
MKTKVKPNRKKPNEFDKFKEFTRQLVNVPKSKIDEQEKKYELQKQKEKG